MTPMKFVGIDGEGVNLPNGEHRYVLLGIGNDQIENANGLSWKDCFTFLYDHFETGTAFVGFYLGYDFTQIFRSLPEHRAHILFTQEGKALRRHRIKGKPPFPVEYEGWQFDLLGMKRLRIRPKLCQCRENTSCKCVHAPWMYICDVGPFFQSSLLTVIDPKKWPGIVTEEEYKAIKKGKDRRADAQLDDEMRYYNRLENEVLVRVMTLMDEGFRDMGVHLSASKWFGPGQAAQAWLKNISAPIREDIETAVPVWALEAARMSYVAGWFEIFMHGIIPGSTHEYDVNSAYPFIISTLPCLLHGTWSRGEGIPRVKEGEWCLVYASVWSPGMPTSKQSIGSMLHRTRTGSIMRPLATEGWFWWHELKAAEKAGLVKRLDNRGHQKIYRWVKYSPCDCPPPLADIARLYELRLQWGKKTPRGRAARLVYNSAYGKFAQSIGEPLFSNPIYASAITAGCRTEILRAIATHPNGISSVAMVATDGIYFVTPHSKLSISEKLGDWDYKKHHNLTLFKPGVYWNDETREQIANEEIPTFKARGINAKDFGKSLSDIDKQFQSWERMEGSEWPKVEVKLKFNMTSCLQALRRGKWEMAGHIVQNVTVIQDSNPSSKRIEVYRDILPDGRTVYRSKPHFNLMTDLEKWIWIPSIPYQKRFGMDDPWSDEYQEQFGVTPDGNVSELISWVLTGKA